MAYPIMLLHAFLASSRMWQPLRATLPESVELITPDFRGAPGVPIGGAEPSVDVLADDVAALLDERGLDRVILGGLSMGGYVTMAVLRRHAERVAAVVLADTKPTADDETARANRYRLAEIFEKDGNTRLAIEELFPLYIGPTTKAQRPEAAALVKAMVEDAPAAGAAWWERMMAARPDSTETLRRVGVPALVIVGDEDPVSTPSDAAEMAALMPNARVVRIATAGHFTAVEDTEAFAAALLEFVAQVG